MDPSAQPLPPQAIRLITALSDKTAPIGVMGLGYVGLPLALALAEAGFTVRGFDTDRAKLDRLAAGQSYLSHYPAGRVAAAVAGTAAGGRLIPEGEVAGLAGCGAVALCVPTPLDRYRQPDLSFVTGTAESLAPHLGPGTLVALESTTYPGTLDEVVRPILEAHGLTTGDSLFLVSAPEREDPGNTRFNAKNTPRVIGGVTPACTRVGLALYGQVADTVVPVSSARAAELTKLLENIQRAVNIGLVNEMKTIAHAMGIDIHEVVDAAATKPFGFTRYTPGPGLGGHCIPIDPFYLTWKAREYGLNTRFIELAGEVNRAMPGWVVERLADALNDRAKPLRGARILVLGLAYKKNVNDTRESPAAEILSLLAARGADIAYADPHVPRFPKMRHYAFDLTSTPLTPDSLAAQDAVVLVTDHDGFDYPLIARHAPLIIDTRGRFDAAAPNVARA